jgi:hypothetical protein
MLLELVSKGFLFHYPMSDGQAKIAPKSNSALAKIKPSGVC